MKKKTPPFGKALAFYLLNNDPSAKYIYLFIGINAWHAAKKRSFTNSLILCLPPFESPLIYEWPVRKCDILVIDTGMCEQDYVEGIAICLLHHGANIVHYCSPDYQLTIYEKDFSNA